ncbi:hypothetical protein LJC68_09605 [Bacteroidales bacterium OttesenSCG-928-B11]|nr:hypothetical protein [Bacteroidales bacterium OttesenSCG-928-B11]
MHLKSMFQLLAPIAVIIVVYLVWHLLIFLFMLVLGIFEGRFYGVDWLNIFEFDGSGATAFWIISGILIIIAELFISSQPKEDFE